MNNQFDELTKNLAQAVTRRAALKKFGFGLAGMALACFGLAPKSEAGNNNRLCGCTSNADCPSGKVCSLGDCIPASGGTGPCVCKNCHTLLPACSVYYSNCVNSCRFDCRYKG
jgi:hypothetical protein